MRIKRLDLSFWMTMEDLLQDCLEHSTANYEPTTAVVGNPGIYYVGETAWFELPDGRAFSYPCEDFKYSLALLHAGEFTAEQVEGLSAIVKTKFATASQLHWHYMYRDWYSIRQTYRSSRKHMVKFMRKAKAKRSS